MKTDIAVNMILAGIMLAGTVCAGELNVFGKPGAK
jgi:hypothetical protein